MAAREVPVNEFFSEEERRECRAYDKAQCADIARNCWAGVAIAGYITACNGGNIKKTVKWLNEVIVSTKGNHKTLMGRLEQEACVFDVTARKGLTRYRDINKPRAYMLLNEIQALNALRMGAMSVEKMEAVCDSGLIRAFRTQEDDNGLLDMWLQITDEVIASQKKMGLC
jgi:hypothetical protein